VQTHKHVPGRITVSAWTLPITRDRNIDVWRGKIREGRNSECGRSGRVRNTGVRIHCWARWLRGLRIGTQFGVCYQHVNMSDLRLPPRSR
jgi:hypothetical protein